MRRFARVASIVGLHLFGAALLHADDAGLPKLIIYGDSAVPHESPDGNFLPTRKTRDLVEAFLVHTGLEHEFAMLPWPRALREVEESDNGLIFALLRMPDREARFHWILPLTEAGPMRLYARKDATPVGFAQDTVETLRSTAACEKAAAQCMVLRDFGFPRDRILLVPEARDGAVEQMVLRGRADFMAGFDDAVAGNLSRLGYAPDALVPVADLNNVPDYLAAPKMLDARLLKRLQDAVKTFQPPE
jgi:polar amino acid transport system substrate-binding protein